MEEYECNNGVWIDRAATLCDKGSRQKYLDLINTQLCWLFPEFVHNIQAQSPQEREMSRVAVIEYQDEAPPTQRTFKTSKELHCYFERPECEEGSAPRRRLFLLEDLSLNYIESLGSQLRIPPSFFGAHWADPASPTFNYRSPFSRFANDAFVVRYPSTQPIRIDAPPNLQSTVYRCNSNVSRHIHCYDPKSPIIDQPKSYHVLSFWTSGERKDGSWDAVLIVDPPVGEYVKSLPDGILLKADHSSTEHAYSRMHSLAPDFNDINILPSDPGDWAQGWIRPTYSSMFDDILSATAISHPRVSNPRTSTEIARKLAICIFLTFLRRRVLNMLKLHANPRAAALNINRCDYLRQFGHGVLSSWHHELFGFVVNVKYIMGIVARETEDNVAALGLNRRASTAGGGEMISSIPQWEHDGWIAIQEHCDKIITMADAFLQSYLQFTSMQEAQAANKNALSLARITTLTMVFIPLSTVAAIFSMSEDFMPGKSKSWIFWVTALPVLVVMIAWTTESRAGLTQYWKACREKRRLNQADIQRGP
ncbi:Nn.00g000240.m01.CDS01 [Neocucurbitaria sp. VM-36]